MARKINAVSPNESRLNGYFADPERRNTSNFRGISYEDERRAHANEIYESGTKWVNEQLQSGGGSGGGAQPDWNAAEGEPGHILNRTHYFKIAYDHATILNGFVDADEGMYLYLGDPVVFIPGREYTIRYAGTYYKCVGLDSAVLGESVDGACVFGNVGAATGGEDTGEPFVILSYGRKMANMGGASVMILDLSGAGVNNVIIDGPYQERVKIAPEWLPHPEIGLLTYIGTLEGNGTISVPHKYTYEDISARIKNGHILSARVDLGTEVIGLNFRAMYDGAIEFVNCDVNNNVYRLHIGYSDTTVELYTHN